MAGSESHEPRGSRMGFSNLIVPSATSCNAGPSTPLTAAPTNHERVRSLGDTHGMIPQQSLCSGATMCSYTQPSLNETQLIPDADSPQLPGSVSGQKNTAEALTPVL